MENRNLQIINCDIGRDVINSPPAWKEYRNLQIYLEKSQLSQLSQKSQISQFMLSPTLDTKLLHVTKFTTLFTLPYLGSERGLKK